MNEIKKYRTFLKSNVGLVDDMPDKEKSKPHPPLQKCTNQDDKIIELPLLDENVLIERDIYKCIKQRKSRRKYTDESISINELTYLLWATQGVEKALSDNSRTYRTVPSAGGRHPFETYLVINNVEGLDKGIYRYLPLTNQLVFLFEDKEQSSKINNYTFNQQFVGKGAVVFIWSCIPYRSEWEYYTVAHKAILLDAGHVCQNLYLACESIGLGTCAIASYKQRDMDEFLNLNGEEEFVVYLAPVGKF